MPACCLHCRYWKVGCNLQASNISNIAAVLFMWQVCSIACMHACIVGMLQVILGCSLASAMSR